MQENRYNRNNRRKYLLKARLVLVTKYRKKLLTGDIDGAAKKCIADTAKNNGWDIVAMETDKDHVHILLSYDAADRICDIVKVIKQTTAYYPPLLKIHSRTRLNERRWRFLPPPKGNGFLRHNVYESNS